MIHYYNRYFGDFQVRWEKISAVAEKKLVYGRNWSYNEAIEKMQGTNCKLF